VAAQEGWCPLVFEIASNGSGLGVAVVDGIDRLVNSTSMDVGARLVDDPSDPVNAPEFFVDYIEADAEAPSPCTQGLVALDLDPIDGVPDTFEDVPPGTSPCFNLVLKTNTAVPPIGTPQVFGVTIEVIGDGVTVLDDRRVFFRVPP